MTSVLPFLGNWLFWRNSYSLYKRFNVTGGHRMYVSVLEYIFQNLFMCNLEIKHFFS